MVYVLCAKWVCMWSVCVVSGLCGACVVCAVWCICSVCMWCGVVCMYVTYIWGVCMWLLGYGVYVCGVYMRCVLMWCVCDVWNVHGMA